MLNLEHCQVFDILKVHNKMAQFLFVSPYIMNVKGAEVLEFHTTKTRWVISTLLLIFVHISYLLTIYNAIVNDPRSIVTHPAKLYLICTQITYSANYVTFMIMYHKKKNGMRHLLSIMHRFNGKQKITGKSMILRRITQTFCVINTLVAILSWSNFTGILSQMPIRLAVNDDFIFQNWGISLDWLGIPKNSIVRRIFAISISYLSLYTNIATQLAELLIILISGSLLLISIQFMSLVKENSSNVLEEVFANYQDLKDLTENVSNVVGTLLIFFLLSTIPYFAENFVELGKLPVTQAMVVCYYLSVYLVALLMAADAHHKISKFPDHVFQKRLFWKRADPQQLALITTELTMTQIGLRGNGWFMVSYSLLGNTISIIITYIIIMLQFKNVQ